MSEQQSQKRGVRSEDQKTTTARHGYEPIPAANPVAGAFGDQQRPTPSNKDVAYSTAEKRNQDESREVE